MNKLILALGIVTVLFLGAINLSTVFAATYDCQVTVNGKGCIIAQKAKDDIRNTINIVVSGNGGTGTPSGNGTDYSGDINTLKGDVSALQATAGNQQNQIIELKNKDTSQDQADANVTNQIAALKAENTQLRTDVNTLLDFMNNGTQIVVLPDNGNQTSGGGDNSTTTTPPIDNTEPGNSTNTGNETSSG